MIDEADERRAVWDRVADAWARNRDFMWNTTRHVGEWLVDHVDPKPGDVILDLAGGLGSDVDARSGGRSRRMPARAEGREMPCPVGVGRAGEEPLGDRDRGDPRSVGLPSGSGALRPRRYVLVIDVSSSVSAFVKELDSADVERFRDALEANVEPYHSDSGLSLPGLTMNASAS